MADTTKCLRGAHPVVFGSPQDMAPQLREVPWAATVVCGDDRSQIHHNDVCNRIRTFPATMVNGTMHEGLKTAADLEKLCRQATAQKPADGVLGVVAPPPVCNVPRVQSRYPTGSFLNPSWDAAGSTRAYFKRLQS